MRLSLNLSAVDSNNALVGGGPGKSLKEMIAYGLGLIGVSEILSKVKSIVDIEIKLANLASVFHELKVRAFGIGERNEAYACVKRIVVDINGKSLGMSRFCNGIKVIGNLDGYLGGLTTVFLIDRNRIVDKRGVGSLFLALIHNLVRDNRSYGHCVVVIIYDNINVMSVFLSALIPFCSEACVNYRGSLVVDIE